MKGYSLIESDLPEVAAQVISSFVPYIEYYFAYYFDQFMNITKLIDTLNLN